MSTATINRKCGKCHGTGKVRAYSHIAAGDCFACNAAGYFVTTVAKERARKASAARREAQRKERAARYIAARMREAKEAGWSLQQYHDSVCYCGGGCVTKSGMDAEWAAV